MNSNVQDSHVQVAKTSRVSEQRATDKLPVTLWTSRGRHSEEEALIRAQEKVWVDITSLRHCDSSLTPQ